MSKEQTLEILEKEDGTYIHDKRYNCALIKGKFGSKYELALDEFELGHQDGIHLIKVDKDMLESIVRMYNAIRRKK